MVRITQGHFIGVVQVEVADDPPEERLFGRTLAGRGKGGGREVEAGEDATSSVDPVEPLDPLGLFPLLLTRG